MKDRYQNKDGSSRTRTTIEREDRAIVRASDTASYSWLSTIHRADCIHVSNMTLDTRLKERNLCSIRPLWRLPLTPVYRRVRWNWFCARSARNCADWGHKIFSDESYLQLCPDNNRRRQHPGQCGETCLDCHKLHRPTTRCYGLGCHLLW